MRKIDADALVAVLEEMQSAACDGTENDGSDGTTRIEYPVQITTQEMIDLIASQPTVADGSPWIPVEEVQPHGKD